MPVIHLDKSNQSWMAHLKIISTAMGPVHNEEIHVVQAQSEQGAVHSPLGPRRMAVLGHELAREMQVLALNHLLLEDQPQRLSHLALIAITVHMPASSSLMLNQAAFECWRISSFGPMREGKASRQDPAICSIWHQQIDAAQTSRNDLQAHAEAGNCASMLGLLESYNHSAHA